MISVADMEFIVALAKNTSLAAAARDLNISPPAVSQRLSSLETKMGLRLIERSGRGGVLLTSDGELLAERAINILADIDSMTSELADRQKKIVGRLRVMAPLGFGRHYIAPVIADFRQKHSDVSIDLTLSDNLAQLPDQSWDIIIQVAPLADSGLIAIKLAENERFVCASPEYLETHPSVETPQDLINHVCLTLRENEEDDTYWSFKSADDDIQQQVNVRVKSQMSANDGETLQKWAHQGLGIIQRSEWAVQQDIRDGKLVRLLGDFHLPAAPVVALVTSRTNRATRVQTFIDFLKDAFAQPKWHS
ncbi:LysR family transcriptional regulator [Kordiimonas sp. SCSIO 12603]|uniref:LysR family transcriptional regulator n=1 Tax=Kordiimonas sp. SCSIO 12603 TaxID=2829596 RepID=UPI00210847A7|nr:LysR family transcriptional regulator [Kordiimonas sp. SCSIO 12603]UTW58786.1 LysR family transcriptional regulator [Kordiimonas sp. SCSIO 12603]